MSRPERRILLVLTLAAFTFAGVRPGVAQTRAGDDDSGSPRRGHHAPAAADTSHFLPSWLRPWIEFGGGWMSGPGYLKSHYESGQGLGAGLEARLRSRWALRGAIDYQMLLANNETRAYVAYPLVDSAGGYAVDTLKFTTQTTGWLATARGEAGLRLAGDVWFTAGAGGGYMHSGLSGLEDVNGYGYQVIGSRAVDNGWGWLWTAALRYDFEPAPRVPLGVDVRTSSLRRGHDDVRTWSVRVGLRMPEGPARGGPPRPR